VPWDDVVGIDYARPLHQDGRLVLEVKRLTKRTFRSVRLCAVLKRLSMFACHLLQLAQDHVDFDLEIRIKKHLCF
jgi:hypothetical protein